MQPTEHGSFDKPDEVREFPNGRSEVLKVGDAEIGRLVFEPGWRWSEDAKTSLPSGHDAWVVGDEPVVVVDWFGASNYAKAH